MRFLILLTISTFTLAASGQISVPQTTKSFYAIVEATWCGLCGQYGKPATTAIINQTNPKAIYVSLHKSATSALHAPIGTSLGNAFNAAGQPVFTLNGINEGPYSASIVTDISNTINGIYNPSYAAVNSGFEYGIVGDSLYVFTRTEFFEDLTGDYYTAIYVFEDSIWEWQANYDSSIPDMDIWHNHVLRASLNGTFGQEVANGSIPQGSAFQLNAKMLLDSDWNPAQLHVFTVIWKKNGSTYEFVNANDVGTLITGTVNTVDFAKPDVQIYPNPAATIFQISGIYAEPSLEVRVFDLQGVLHYQSEGELICDVSGLSNGTYLVQICSQGKTYLRKLIKI